MAISAINTIVDMYRFTRVQYPGIPWWKLLLISRSMRRSVTKHVVQTQQFDGVDHTLRRLYE